MTYLLDTNVAIAVIRNRPTVVRERLRAAFAEGASIALSTIVTYELQYGVAKSPRRQEAAGLLEAFLAGDFTTIEFTNEDAAVAGEVRARLEAVGTPIGPYDLLIAAQALRRQATLVTSNASEFSRVDGLVWQDWSQ